MIPVHSACLMYVVSLVLLLLSCCASLVIGMLHALHYNYIWFLEYHVMSPAEGLHFSALVEEVGGVFQLNFYYH